MSPRQAGIGFLGRSHGYLVEFPAHENRVELEPVGFGCRLVDLSCALPFGASVELWLNDRQIAVLSVTGLVLDSKYATLSATQVMHMRRSGPEVQRVLLHFIEAGVPRVVRSL